jgi:2'-5' RNA ligase
MKYFIGITPPKEINERIASFQRSFVNNKLPEILEPHITVKTKNGLAEDRGWLNKVKSIIENYPRFGIAFEGVDTFGDSVVVLKPCLSKELIALHKALFYAIEPDEEDATKKYYENDKFEAHFTLGMDSWGMTKEELVTMKERGLRELSIMPSFEVAFIRVYQQISLDEPYKKFLDIPLNGAK